MIELRMGYPTNNNNGFVLSLLAQSNVMPQERLSNMHHNFITT